MNQKAVNEQEPVAQSAASGCAACNGCQYQSMPSDGWCYMFRDAPDDLPCGQHDKFAEERKAMGRLVAEQPAILGMMIAGAKHVGI